MNAPLVKGYCPGALNPMMSGDGMVVRLRPFGGRLRRAQADGIAALAMAHGNGLLDLSSRGNLQIRGVRQDSYAPLIEGLRGMSLLDKTPAIEARRNILVTPFWSAGEETEAFSAALTDALASDQAPALPHKFGFAVDTGAAPVLQSASADIRMERAADGTLLLAAEGAKLAKVVTPQTIIAEAMALANWFMTHSGGAGRMAALTASADLPDGFDTPRAPQSYTPVPAKTAQGALVGLAFGQLPAATLASLAKHGGLRMTPWRMLLVEGAQSLPDVAGLITDPDDPLLRVVACSGRPACAQALTQTRPLARALAGHLPDAGVLHVSGCAKGCAHPRAAAVTVVGAPEGLSLVRQGRAGDEPQVSGLTLDALQKAI